MLGKLFDDSFMPHGHCFLWRSDLLILHVVGDVLTAVSYGVIPFGLIYIVRKRQDLSFGWLFMLFAAFIFFCGVSHVLGLVNIWHGYYYIEGVVKLLTGVVSAATAIILIKLTAKLISIPSARDLELSNGELVKLRDQLQEANYNLERRVAQRTEQLEQLAKTDALTGIYNRGEIMRRGYAEFERADRYQRPMAALMIDVDFFKKINDRYGHQFGDEILKRVAAEVKSCCRLSDSFGRYGGEEFLLICPEMDKVTAFHLAERIREKIESLPVDCAKGVTVSIGLADSSGEENLETLISSADRALFMAKGLGRNKVVGNTVG